MSRMLGFQACCRALFPGALRFNLLEPLLFIFLFFCPLLHLWNGAVE